MERVSSSEVQVFLINQPILCRTEQHRSENPCLLKVVDYLLKSKDKAAKQLGEHIRSFSELSFAQLLFGDGKNDAAINLQTALSLRDPLYFSNNKLYCYF
jgi:succinylglutamate desuccinylase